MSLNSFARNDGASVLWHGLYMLLSTSAMANRMWLKRREIEDGIFVELVRVQDFFPRPEDRSEVRAEG